MHMFRFPVTCGQKSDFNIQGAGEISGNIQLPGKLLPFQRVFHRFWQCEKCPVHRFWDFLPHEKHCESSEVFHRFFHRLKTRMVFHRVLHRFWPCENCPFHRFWHFHVKNTVKVHRFFRVFHRFFHRVKTHRVFHRVLHGFWPCENCPFHRFWHFLPCEKHCESSQVFHRVFHRVLHGFWPCENCPFHRVSTLSHPVKKVWKNMWNWTVHMFLHRVFHRFFTAFSQVFIQ